ncbi:malonic semialdehyde reductase [Pseudonocardia autotrophica]|uniref:Malonic semialdehyde reductase n=1 Tax=Pseudonocardia autotrophica TaxID=2074 RepID=A0A1Y2MJA5_PSEAH|nr:malonic semialdehyde reductase [Pseudonocardia autotrophica]
MRTFSDQPVAPEVVRSLIDTARWTGSARNRQPWRFRIVTDRHTCRELAGLGTYARHLADAPSVLVLFAADDGRRDTLFDVGRIAQSVVLAAADVGLGCCPATIYPDSNVDRAGEILGVESSWRARWCFSLGHPGRAATGTSAVPVGRRSVEDLLI